MSNSERLQRGRRLLAPWRRTGEDVVLVPIGWAIGGMLAIALAIAAGVAIVAFLIVPFKSFRPEPLSAATVYDLLKVAFAFAAGVGGVVALVTAYRRQRISEFAEERGRCADKRDDARLFNERFATAAGQIGSDSPAVRLAGVYAMAGLADDWAEQRQTCVDVLCAYLRMPYQREPGEDALGDGRQLYGSLREVRHTVIRVIAAHLQSNPGTVPDWRELNFDFTGAAFDGGRFDGAQFNGKVNFDNAEFASGLVSFSDARFGSDRPMNGSRSESGRSTGGSTRFSNARFVGARVSFARATFTGYVSFGGAQFGAGVVSFRDARFDGGEVSFTRAQFEGARVIFNRAQFRESNVNFSRILSADPAPEGLDWEHPPPGVVPPQHLDETSSDPLGGQPSGETTVAVAAAPFDLPPDDHEPL